MWQKLGVKIHEVKEFTKIPLCGWLRKFSISLDLSGNREISLLSTWCPRKSRDTHQTHSLLD